MLKKSLITLLFLLLCFNLPVLAVDFQAEAGLKVDTDLKIEPVFSLVAEFSNLRIKAANGFVDFNNTVGTDIVTLSSQAVAANLLSSGYDFTFNLLGFSWRYEKLLANLGNDRRFVAHRIKVLREGLPIYLDFYETSVLVGNEKEIYYMYNYVPFLPVYLVQHIGLKNRELDNQDINVLMGFNAGYQFSNQAILYVDVIVDDFPAIPWIDTQLPVMGLSLGYSSQRYALENKTVQFGVATTANTRYLHSHWAGTARYTKQFELLGDELGPDAIKLNGVFNYQKPGLKTALTLGYELHGPGHLDEYWVYIGREEAYKTFFLSEIVEKKANAKVYLEKALTDSLNLFNDTSLVRVFPKDAPSFNTIKSSVGFSFTF